MKRGTRKKTAASGAGKRAARKSAEPELSFEQALERLEDIVHRLEEGEIPLEESIEAYAEGTRLVRRCVDKLSAAETMIKELTEDAGGLRLESSTLEEDEGEDGEENEEDGEEDDEENGSGELPF